MKKENARPSKAESSAVEQRKFTPQIKQKSRTAGVIAADYNGVAIAFTSDAWFNATVAAKPYGKEPAQWLRLPATVAYISALHRKYGNFTYLKTRRGAGGGTWMHPKLAVRFAQWLDVDFAVWCDEQIDHILRGGLSVWNKAGGARSDTTDREPLLAAAAAIVARHRLPFGAVYDALNTFAGVAHAREMTCNQVVESAEFGARLLAGNATPADFAKLEQRRVQLGKVSVQLSLLRGV
ncbi:KilA-N domain-containing protein [Burkholderia gladioli]|uniref:KilA-N domain-containing protein n=1 Tax=Burkholderia gladioli TaxID=28095 RepID=UPI002FE23C24